MSLNFSSSTVSYGNKLPSPNSMADGSLFFKTAPDADGSNPLGLYVFSFQQDSNPSIIGDQVGSGWQLAASAISAGGTIQGDLTIGNTSGYGGVTIVESTTTNPGTILFTNNTNTTIGSLGWDGANSSLYISGSWVFQNPPSLVGGGSFWTSLNDGAASGLDADLLDGQHGSYYLDLGNSTGQLNLANVSGTLSVLHGGTGLSVATVGGILYGSSIGNTAFTAQGVAGQILQSNGAGAPGWVNTSSISIGTAAVATNISGGTAGAIPVQTAPNSTSFISAGALGYVLTSTGPSSAPTWQSSSGGGGATISDVTNIPNSDHYITFVTSNSGSLGTIDVSSTQLTFNPNTGVLSSPNFNSLSDRSAKTNIRELGYGLKDVMKMEGRKFEMISNNVTSIGFIAQEMKEIIPEAVIHHTGNMLGINYPILVSVLVEAMKEQQAQIEELKSLVAKLIDV